MQSARYLRIELTAASPNQWWSIHDIALRQTEDPTIKRPALDSTGWTFGTSTNAVDGRLVIDGSSSTRWTTKTPQKPGQVFQIDL